MMEESFGVTWSGCVCVSDLQFYCVPFGTPIVIDQQTEMQQSVEFN